MSAGRFAAVDLGASSGRVMVGQVREDTLRLEEAHRFANVPVRVGDTLHWDVLALYAGVVDGLRVAVQQGRELTSVGIDGWAVDYGLLDTTGALLGNPVHYRDARTRGMIERTHKVVPAERLYATTGIQMLSLNTIYQLVAQHGSPQLTAARRLLLVPDLISYWLTGVAGAEVTNASTTQLFDVTTRTWARPLMSELGIDATLFAPLREPRSSAGVLMPHVAADIGMPRQLPVTTVCSHDTASAVVAVPAEGENFAYISCGTWSLVGVELEQPVLGTDSLAAGFTNEVGIDGTIRYLRNVMGLWLLQESLRTWNAGRSTAAIESLLSEAANVPAFSSIVDVNDNRFLAPGDMPGRIWDLCVVTGQTPPRTRAETVRCILDSLALAYRSAIRDAQRLSGRAVDTVHLVGGGSQNAFLCQLTADACGLPVVAGPVEAAAIGNVLVQAQAAGDLGRDLASARRLVRGSQHLRSYVPAGNGAQWAAAAERISVG
ncbi:MAG: carbohydrate kinase [Frankiales bacterium]|nr:carbohydrate kinase [Frankiales bacterium]